MVRTLRCLVVGIAAARFADAGLRPDEAASIDYPALPDYAPQLPTLELVVAPLFCASFDALEIMDTLHKQGFRGRLQIVAPKLPNRQIVLRELRSHAARHGLMLELVEEPEAAAP
jgi:hypothetical protein